MPNKPLAASYADDLKLWHGRWQKSGLLCLLVFLLIFPLVASSHWLNIANLTMVSIVAAAGLMILTGFTGQISMGHAAFMAVGAYTVAVLGGLFGLPFWLLIPVAGAAAAAVGLMVGPFALRLEGLYLAIVTIGLSFLVNHFLHSFPEITGGVSGLAVPMHGWFAVADSAGSAMSTPFVVAGITLSLQHKLFALFALITVLSIVLMSRLRNSNTGRAMMAVRDQDTAAAVMGVNPAKAKMIAFGLSSFFAGVAGAMFAYQQQFLTIDPPFNLLMSVQFIAMIIFGGVGTVFGAVAGPLAFVVLTPVMQLIGRQLPLINQLSSDQQSTLLFAVLVIIMLIFEPLGLYGIWLRIKRYFMAWPFSY